MAELMVRGLVLESEDVLAVELVPVGGDVPAWEPGAHVDLVIADGSVRQYSLCGTPGAASLTIAVRHDPAGRGGSAWLHREVRPGDRVTVRGVKNHFALADAPEIVLLAGGVGITPLLPMAERLARGDIPWRLSYIGRSAARMPFLDRVRALGDRARPQEGATGHGHPAPPADQRSRETARADDQRSRETARPGRDDARAPRGDRVRLHETATDGRPDVAALLGDLAPGALVYVCGPASLIDAARAALEARGLGDQLRAEYFEAPDLPAAEPGAFTLRLERSGLDLAVPPGRTALQAVTDAGIDVLTDCEEGICGSCETTVLAGEVDHRDHVLTAREKAAHSCMMLCVSRALGPRLVIDL